MTPSMITVNAGGSFSDATRRDGMLAWAEDAVEQQPLLVFAQEVPSPAWLDVWSERKYRTVFGPERGWKVQSALLVHPAVKVQGEYHHRNRHYHGSYVATAVVSTRSGPAVVASVHASPNEAQPALHGWEGTVPQPRHGGGDRRYVGGRLWDSDLVLATLADLASGGLPLLAAGDLNEATAHDVDARTGTSGTWGREYFQRLADLGLTDHLSAAWGGERATRGGLQLDRVIVDAAGRRLLADGAPVLDAAWEDPDALARLSDHRAVWVPLQPDAWPSP